MMKNDITCTNVNVSFQVSMVMNKCVFKTRNTFLISSARNCRNLCKKYLKRKLVLLYVQKLCTTICAIWIINSNVISKRKKMFWWGLTPGRGLGVEGRPLAGRLRAAHTPGAPATWYRYACLWAKGRPFVRPTFVRKRPRLCTEGVRVVGTERTERSAKFSSDGSFTSERLRTQQRNISLIIRAILQ